MKVLATIKTDAFGRVALPLELRRKLNLEERDSIDILITEKNQIILEKSGIHCKLCGATKNLTNIRSKDFFVCKNCRQEIIELS